MKKRLSVFIPILMLSLCFCSACSDDNNDTQPLTDEDPEEYVWIDGDVDEEPEAQGDKDWDRWEAGAYTNDHLADDPYLQWRSMQWSGATGQQQTPYEVNAVEPWVGGGAFIGAKNGLFRFDPDTESLTRVPAPYDDFQVLDLATGYNNTLYMLVTSENTDERLFSYRLGGSIETVDCALTDSPNAIATGSYDQLLIGSSNGVWELTSECNKKGNYPSGPIVDITDSVDGRIALIKRGLGAADQVHLLDNNQWFVLASDSDEEDKQLIEGRLKSVELFGDRNEMWISLDTGLMRYDNHRRLSSIAAKTGGMPWDNIKQVTLDSTGRLWLATEKGVMMNDPDSDNDRWKVFHSRRWLLEDDVRCIGFDQEGGAWIGHDGGVSRVYQDLWTLEEKAEYFHSILRERHLRMEAFTARCTLAASGDTSDCSPQQLNDEALWTGMYALSEVFRSKTLTDATKKAEAAANAKASLNLLLELEKAPNFDTFPGFPAASIFPRGDGPIDQENWFRSDLYDWLSDTGSDSIVGHVLLYPFYWDLLADEQEKETVAAALGRIATHIIEHNYQLIDPKTGNATTAGRYNDEAVTGALGAEGEGGLNALKVLALLRAAYHITGDDTYWKAYIDRAHVAEYANTTLHQATMSATRKADHASDQLAFLSYLTLLRYADVIDFREIYMDSLEEAFGQIREQNAPLFNIIYGVFKHNGFDLAQAVQTLRETPLDLVDWRIDTCWRADVELNSATDSEGKKQLTEALPINERKLCRYDDNPYACEWSSEDDPDQLGGRMEDDGVFFLLPYWMARYFKMIDAPQSEE